MANLDKFERKSIVNYFTVEAEFGTLRGETLYHIAQPKGSGCTPPGSDNNTDYTKGRFE
jgi:hypothetical protein